MAGIIDIDDALYLIKGGPGSGRYPAGSGGGSKKSPKGGGGSRLIDNLKGDVNEETFPPSITLTEDAVLYHATSNPSSVNRRGLQPSLPPEVKEGVEPDEYKSVTGVYLSDKNTAQAYLDGRLDGKGAVVQVGIPAGTVVFQDPIDYGSVFIQGAIPSYAIYKE